MRKHGDALTGDIFGAVPNRKPVPGSMDFRASLSALLSKMLAEADARGIDRYDVAARASRLTGKTVSANMLDGYTAISRETFNTPLWLAPVLEVACESHLLVGWYCSVRNGQFLAGEDAIGAEIGRLELEKAAAADRIRELKDLSKRTRS